MDFKPSEEQVLLRDSVRRLVEKDYPSATRRKIAAEGGFSQALWRRFAEMGWLGLALPERHGGVGDIRDLAILLEELGAGLVMEPVLASAVVAPRLLIASGDEQRAQAIIPEVIAGDALPVMAHGEIAARGIPEYVAARAERNADGWRLTGNKSLVPGGGTADRYLVSARTGGDVTSRDGITLFMVAANAPGLKRIAVTLTDDSHAADLSFDGLQLPDSAVIGTVDQAFPALREALAWQLLGFCAEALGAMERAMWITRDYVRTRKQFGVEIGSFQAVQHRMADMVVETELSRSLLLRAIDDFGKAPEVRDRTLSAAKVQIGKGGYFIGAQSIQLHGGMGMADECAIGHYYKRLLMLRNLGGSVALHLARIAEQYATDGQPGRPSFEQAPG